MHSEKIHRICGRAIVVLSLIALFTVVTGYTQPRQPLPQDEGTGAHIFQISIALFAIAIVVFFATADWKQPGPIFRSIGVSAAALVLAFSALYYLEHYWFTPR